MGSDFLFRKGLALIGNRDNPDEQKRLFERFGSSRKLKSLYERMKSVVESAQLDAPDPFAMSFPDPNLIAGYLDEPSDKSQYQHRYEEACLDSDRLLAEVASASMILRMFQEETTNAPKSCRQRAYAVGDIDSASYKDAKSNSEENFQNDSYSRGSVLGESEGYSELDAFETSRHLTLPEKESAAPASDRDDRPLSAKKQVKFRRESNFKTRRFESVKSEQKDQEPRNKKRSRFFPFLFAVLGTGLLFHFLPSLRVSDSSSNEPSPVLQSNDSIPAFSEAPVSEKITTPSENLIENSSDWEDITLLSDAERVDENSKILRYRPLRRGGQSDVVTDIPAEE